MMSLFSSFDLYFSSLTLVGFFFISTMLFQSLYKISNTTIIVSEIKNLNSFFLSLKPKMYSKVSLIILITTMISVLSLNFFSVFCFNFPFTSQFGVIFYLGLEIWLSFIMFGMFNNFKGFSMHLIPEGSPIILSFILFMIELVSNIIRPLTLSVRLVANILAGHLLMILLSKMVFSFNGIFLIYAGLNLVELFVALIQSYIFCTMIALYFSEIH